MQTHGPLESGSNDSDERASDQCNATNAAVQWACTEFSTSRLGRRVLVAGSRVKSMRNV